MKRAIVFAGIALSVVVLSGCQGNGADVSALQNETATMKGQLATLSAEKKALEERLGQLEKTVQWNELFSNVDRIAFLSPGSGGYSPVRADIGVLTVDLADIKPYANGSKVTLSFGNPLSATINGLKATIEYGKVNEKNVPLGEAKKKEATFSQSLRAGAWTKVDVVLEGLSPQDLGFVRVRDVTHTGIALNR